MNWTTRAMTISLIFFGVACSDATVEGGDDARVDTNSGTAPSGEDPTEDGETNAGTVDPDTAGNGSIGGKPDLDPDPKDDDPSVDAPYPAWALTAGGSGNDWPHAIASDDDGNVYVGGTFETRFVVDGTAIEPTHGSADAFLIALDKSGSLLWHVVYGSGGTDRAMGLDTDDDGNVYVVGDHDGALFVGNVMKPSIGSKDAHVLKFGPGGTLNWMKAFGGDRTDSAGDVSVSADGHVTVVGYYQDEITVDREVFASEVSSGSNDAFVVSLDAVTGAARWVKGFHGWGSDIATAVATRDDGDIVVGVSMQYDLVIDSGLSWSASDTFAVGLVAYDSDGNLQWDLPIGGPGQAGLADLAIGSDGSIFAAGSFKGTGTFAGETFTTPDDKHDVWVAAWTATGEPIWADQAGGDSIDQAMGLAVGDGEIFVTGRFFDELIVQGESAIANGEYDGFVITYSAENGNREGLRTFGGVEDELPAGVAWDGDRGFFVAGYTRGTFEFGDDSWNAPGSGLDAFLLRSQP